MRSSVSETGMEFLIQQRYMYCSLNYFVQRTFNSRNVRQNIICVKSAVKPQPTNRTTK